MRPVPDKNSTYEETLNVPHDMPVIQVDFDGTIAMWDIDMKDYEINEAVKEYLIKKSPTHVVYICTARGTLSCALEAQANRKLAHETYYGLYHDILTKSEIPFDVLSFNKVLATEYIDDNATNVNDINKETK